MKEEKRKQEKVQLGWEISVKAKEEFMAWCRQNGIVVQVAAAGAIILYRYLPASVRELAQAHASGVEGLELPREFFEEFAAGLEEAFSQYRNRPDKD